MCGLVAVFSRKSNGFTVEENAQLNISMMLNQARGDDSTGMVVVDNKNTWSYIKSVGGYKSLCSHRNHDEFRKVIMNDGRLVLGHGRWATRGTVTVDNAHPFHIKSDKDDQEIIFMHNGTLHGYQTIGPIHQYSVDSEFLGKMIVEHGADKALSEIDGAMAIMWWDAKTHTFNFYRNNERPLYYMQTKKGEMYLNSEKWILEFLNHRYNLKVEDKEIYMLQDMIHNSVVINGRDTGKLTATTITKAKKSIATSAWGGRYADNYSDDMMYGGRALSNIYGANGNYGANSQYSRTIYTDDIPPPEDKELWDRSIDTIEWFNDEKTTLYRDRRRLVEKNSPPPEPNLIRMYEVKHTGDVMKGYQRKGESMVTYVSIQYKEFMAAKALREPAKHQNKVVQIGHHKANEMKFSTRHVSGVKVKHKGIILQGNKAPHLVSYENTIDGIVTVGDTKLVEVCYAEELDNNKRMVRVVCAEIKEKQDSYIDYVFYTTIWNKEQVERIQFFKGRVGSIMMGDREYALANGSYGICNLCQVVPCTGEEPNAAAQVEAPAPNATTTPSVH